MSLMAICITFSASFISRGLAMDSVLTSYKRQTDHYTQALHKKINIHRTEGGQATVTKLFS